MGFSTKAVHCGDDSTDPTGSVVVPIYQTSTYKETEPGTGNYVYLRTGNPTRNVLERAIASLEEGKYGLAFSSGMAAESTIALSCLRKGDHVVAVKDLYGETRRLFDRVLSKLGIQFTYVEGAEPAQFEAAMKPETKMFWAESPSNPLLRIVDLRRTADVAHKHNSIFVVDNTFMSSYLQQPLKLGADIVVHSTTKYLGGHSDLIGGAVVVSDEELHQNIRFAQNAVGPFQVH